MRYRLGIAAVVALIILNIFLIPRALQQGRGDADGTPSPSPATQPAAGTADPGAEPESAPSGSASPAAPEPTTDTALDGTTLMSARDDVVVQAQRGGCDTTEPARVVVSTDGGTTFEPVDLDTELRAVLALRITDEQIALVGADTDCQAVTLTSGHNGRVWSRAPEAAVWRLVGDPAEAAIQAPEERVSTPCVPVALSVEGDAVVRVLCEEGRLLGRDGEEWAALGRLPGASAIRYPTAARGFAIAPGEACPTSVFGTRDGGTRWTELACLDGADGPGAIAGQDGEYVARAGAVTLVSHDGGESWQQP